MASKKKDAEEVACHFQERLASIYTCSTMKNLLVKGFCQSLNRYMYSNLVKEDYGSIQSNEGAPEHFQILVTEVATGLNKQLNQFMDFVYIVQLLFSPGMEVNITENVTVREQPKENLTIDSLRERLNNCMNQITPLLDTVVGKFRDFGMDTGKRHEPSVEIGNEKPVTIESDSDHDDCGGPIDDAAVMAPDPATEAPNTSHYFPGIPEQTAGSLTDEELIDQILLAASSSVDGTSGNVLTAQTTVGESSGTTAQGEKLVNVELKFEGQCDTRSRHFCERCGSYFHTKGFLIKHIDRDHRDPYPFMCEHCGWRFKSKRNCELHVAAKHMKEKNQVCSECGSAFASDKQLTRHMMTSHGPRQHICEHCGKAFRKRHKLNVHMNIHTGERPYVCDICGKGFADPTTTRKHRLTHKRMQDEWDY